MQGIVHMSIDPDIVSVLLMLYDLDCSGWSTLVSAMESQTWPVSEAGPGSPDHCFSDSLSLLSLLAQCRVAARINLNSDTNYHTYNDTKQQHYFLMKVVNFFLLYNGPEILILPTTTMLAPALIWSEIQRHSCHLILFNICLILFCCCLFWVSVKCCFPSNCDLQQHTCDCSTLTVAMQDMQHCSTTAAGEILWVWVWPPASCTASDTQIATP